MKWFIKLTTLIIITLLALPPLAAQSAYAWLSPDDSASFRIADVPVLSGFNRVQVRDNSFAKWLRHLPMKTENNTVYLYDGRIKPNQNAHYRVLNIDVGNRNLQQCADAIMRLRAEYLFSIGRYDEIAFHFTSEDLVKYSDWIDGLRPRVKGNHVSWIQGDRTGVSYSSFRKYLRMVFIYAGSWSLSRELRVVHQPENIRIGDIFIQGGFPGHAVIVVDLIENKRDSEKAMLLAQSYMPAQEIHILKNENDTASNPWYPVKQQEPVKTPEWTFMWSNLKRF